MLKQSVAEDGTVHSVVSVKQKDGTFSDREDDKTVMVDEQTKIQYTVKDTGKVQKVSVTDERIPEDRPPVPQTGGNTPVIPMAVGFIMAVGAAVWMFRKRKVMGN